MLYLLQKVCDELLKFYNYFKQHAIQMPGDQNPQIQEKQAKPVLIPVQEFAAKYRSKRECYNFLAVDADVYLPPYGKCSQQLGLPLINLLDLVFADCVTIYFLKDLVMGKKKKILGKDVRHIAIPQYEELTINKIAEFVGPYPVVDDYLPIRKEIPKVPKQWLGNVCHTVLKNMFSDWVKAKVSKRNEELAIKRDLMINMDPDIAAAFRSSNKVSRKFSSLNYVSFIFFFYSPEWHRRAHAEGRLETAPHPARDRGGQAGGE